MVLFVLRGLLVSVGQGDLAEFRQDVRDWCAVHVNGARQQEEGLAPRRQRAEDVTIATNWLARLRAAGYAAPHWPAPWGPAWSIEKQVVLFEELAAADAPSLDLLYVSLHHAADSLLAFGTEQQQREHLPAILDGTIWCQGFSEPGAGSDLAAIRTRAVREGDVYRVSGQKIWSSAADVADWCLLLVRTSSDGPKHHGLSYFILDMRSAGVDVRPIRQSTGAAEFAEIFLDDVLIPAENLLGEEDDGWRVALTTLASERGTGTLELVEGLRAKLPQMGAMIADANVSDGARAAFRARFGEVQVRSAVLKQLSEQMVEAISNGDDSGSEASLLKLLFSELLQDSMLLATSVGGLDAMRPTSSWNHTDPLRNFWAMEYVGSWLWTISGGTNEIQRNIIAERTLGLPKEPHGGVRS